MYMPWHARYILVRSLKAVLYCILFLLIFFLALAIWDFTGFSSASRSSAGIAPDPEQYPDAVVQVYAAELWGWRGLFADHIWIATKQKNADTYTVYEVIGWRLSDGYDSALRIAHDIPDRKWYDAVPRVLVTISGETAEPIVEHIHRAALRYPYKKEYSAFGPNSNTFIAWMACSVPELNLTLSNRAIGKRYIQKESCSEQ